MNIKTWINDLRVVSNATEGINMSMMAVGAADYSKAIEGLSFSQAKLLLSLQGLDAEQQTSLLLQAGLISSSEQMQAKHVAQALTETTLENTEKNRILTKLGLVDAETGEILTSQTCTSKKLLQALATTTLNEEEKQEILTKVLGTVENGKYAVSFNVLTGAIWNNIKAMVKWLATNPAGWVILATTAITALEKGYDALLGKQEKLSRQKLEDINIDIEELDEEISSLEGLQVKLEEAKGSKYELSQISSELNKVIGKTEGLLNGESNAWDKTNMRLKANIELKKAQRKQAQQDKISASKDLYDNNSIKIDWHFDMSGKDARKYAKAISWMNGKTLDEFYDSDEYKALSGKQQSSVWDATGFKNSYTEEWSDYWNEQVELALSIFDEAISNYEGAGGQNFVKGLISDMVQDGFSLAEMSDTLYKVIDNQAFQDAINNYWDSLADPNIDSEQTLGKIREIFDGIIATQPSLKDFFDDFYDNIAVGGNAVSETFSAVNNVAPSISDLEKVSDNIGKLSSAYKELNDDGYITIGTINDLQEATGLSGDEWTAYENKLLNAKKGSAEFNQVMSDLTYKIIENQVEIGDLTNATDEEIAAIEKKIAATLRENGVTNASAVAHSAVVRASEQAAAAKATEATAAYANALANGEDAKAAYENAQALLTECGSVNAASSAMEHLNVIQNIFNNTNLNASQKIAELQRYGFQASLTAAQLSSLADTTMTYSDGKWWVNYYEEDKDNNGEKDYLYSEEYKGFEYKMPEITIPDYSSTIKDSSKKAEEDVEKAEEERIKKELEALKASLEMRQKLLDKYKEAIDLSDFGLELAEENDFALRADLLNNKMSQLFND